MSCKLESEMHQERPKYNNRVRIQEGAAIFPSPKNGQTGSGAHTATYSTGAGVLPGVKTAGEQS